MTSTAIVGRAGKVTGGGKIGDSGFDFEAQPDGNAFKGNLSYQDKANNVDVNATSITFVSILSDNAHATVKGTATVNGIPGYTFRVDLEDNGEPGNGFDRFRIRFTGPATYDSNAFASTACVYERCPLYVTAEAAPSGRLNRPFCRGFR